MSETTYNGWSNYETWCVKLWLDNEEGSCRYWEDAARHAKDATALAEQLKDEVNEASPLTEASLFSDLLNAALSDVDWYEIAQAMIADNEDA